MERRHGSYAMFGGNSFCRICGTVHNSGKVCVRMYPMQKVQIAIEAVENCISNICLKKRMRGRIVLKLTELRDVLNVPAEPIYCKSVFAGDNKEHAYEPTEEMLGNAERVFDYIEILIEENAYMRQDEEEEIKKFFDNLKKEIFIKSVKA